MSSVKPFSPFFTTLYYFGETDLHTRFLPTSLLPLRERERERERGGEGGDKRDLLLRLGSGGILDDVVARNESLFSGVKMMS